MNTAQKQYLQEHKIEEITSHLDKAVIYVDTETTLEETCKYLGQNGISSVPILDVQQNKFVGIIDIVDIAFFISHAYDQKHKNPDTMNLELFKDVRAIDLLPISQEGKLMWSFSPKETVDHTLEPFCKGVHRALITTEGDQKYHILSQMDVISFIFNSKQFDNIFNKTIIEIKDLFRFKPATLQTMQGDAPAIEGFKKLGINKLGGIAVLDPEGKIIGNLSAADLRGVAVEFLVKTILRPAKDFILLVHGREKDSLPITSKFSDTLGSAVEKMIKNHAHRVWIVDDQGKLNSLVSLSDVCRVFADL